MLGAIIGDVIGSRFESSPRYPKRPVKTKNFNLFYNNSRFTDDTVLTCATAAVVMNETPTSTLLSNAFQTNRFENEYRSWGKRYPDRGYGGGFRKWLEEPAFTQNNSYANGAMMRCSPIGLYYKELPDALAAAAHSVFYTHNSPESVRGVKSIVSAIHMARNGKSKDEIRAHVEEYYGHMLDMTVEDARNIPKTSIRCNKTAPQALVCFMESVDYESAVRNAIYLGGDTDTNAAIAGAIAEAFYGVESIPNKFIVKTQMRLNDEIIALVNRFYLKTHQAAPFK